MKEAEGTHNPLGRTVHTPAHDSTHTAMRVPSLLENPPDEDMDEPQCNVQCAATKPQCLPPETTIDEITYHNPAEAVVPQRQKSSLAALLALPSFFSLLTHHYSRSGLGQNTGPHSHPYPDPRFQATYSEDETNTVPHTHFSSVCNIRYLHCLISDLTNADQSKAKTQDTPPHTPDPRFSATTNTKQIRPPHTRFGGCVAILGYHTIDTARDIPPLKNWLNPDEQGKYHTPTRAGVWCY
ncbi:hypothetical protein BS47DRAFT_1368297 [Hydnum rufescens UP504]|uniref:Uncharacterized protein n=1 Tax=Hydnum rufescens UP504 TaxID=1448309 RepID=A0A9P6DP00_9AGAM|nr:hypothetical protein BS47DRAFT_1368297 [Hydnum rufescens UP504]